MQGIPDYFDVIKNPMDFSRVKSRLQVNHYQSISEFKSDVQLVFQNAIIYNGENSDVGCLASMGLNELEREIGTNMNELL